MKPPACSWRTVMVRMLLLLRSDSTRSMFSSPADAILIISRCVHLSSNHASRRPSIRPVEY